MFSRDANAKVGRRGAMKWNAMLQHLADAKHRLADAEHRLADAEHRLSDE